MSLCCEEARTLLTITDNSTQTIAVLQHLKYARKRSASCITLGKRITPNRACFPSLQNINIKDCSIAVDLVTAIHGNSSAAEC